MDKTRVQEQNNFLCIDLIVSVSANLQTGTIISDCLTVLLLAPEDEFLQIARNLETEKESMNNYRL